MDGIDHIFAMKTDNRIVVSDRQVVRKRSAFGPDSMVSDLSYDRLRQRDAGHHDNATHCTEESQ